MLIKLNIPICNPLLSHLIDLCVVEVGHLLQNYLDEEYDLAKIVRWLDIKGLK